MLARMEKYINARRYGPAKESPNNKPQEKKKDDGDKSGGPKHEAY